MFERVMWCSVCNSAPADGELTVILEGNEEILPACYSCVDDPSKVQFV